MSGEYGGRPRNRSEQNGNPQYGEGRGPGRRMSSEHTLVIYVIHAVLKTRTEVLMQFRLRESAEQVPTSFHHRSVSDARRALVEMPLERHNFLFGRGTVEVVREAC
jgi:hypothetical protein